MLSLSQFRKHIFAAFELMRETGETFDVVYKHVVYEVSVRRTQKVPNLTRAKVSNNHELVTFQTDVCACGALRFNNVCMNAKCDVS